MIRFWVLEDFSVFIANGEDIGMGKRVRFGEPTLGGFFINPWHSK
jgi:hypothetical protein